MSEHITCAGYTCPSRTNCKRCDKFGSHVGGKNYWFTREAGASACKHYLPINPPLTTFKD